MAKLAVCVNHAAPFHVGGSEKVVQQITRSMKHDYGMDCHVLTKFTHQSMAIHDGITIERCLPTPDEFLFQMKTLDADYILTYSDCFSHWQTLVREAENIRGKQSIALVGMNHMLGHPILRTLFYSKRHLFRCIVHSDNYLDSAFCREKQIPFSVIPNAIDMSEFIDQGFSFRKKYKIETPKIVLCVSNFFPGKGQDHLLHALNKVAQKNKDFTAVFMCTKVSFFVANKLMERFEILLRRNAGFPFVFIKDAPRKDTIQSFIESDVFAFPSQQEVAPLVVLEAMATRTPWIGLPVGNLPTLPGGIVLKTTSKIKDQFQFDEPLYEQFADCILQILRDDALADRLGSEGEKHIKEQLNWDRIKQMYYDVLTS